MKLPLPPIFGSKKKSECFLTLLLRDDKASAVIIEEYLGKVKIIAKHEEHFPITIENATEEEMLSILDRTISAAEETLPANIEVTKTVFGVKESWIEEKKIKKEYLLKLKKVCDGLDLSPIGFLVTSEAIAHLLQEEEGAPLSAVLVEVGKNTLTLSLFRGGKLVESHTADIEDDIPKQVDLMLKHFTDVEVLPSRIIIFDGDREEVLSQKFITHQWSKSLPFLHMPQVAILPKGFDARSIVFGAATQMGFGVASQIFSKDTLDAKVIKTTASTTDTEKPSAETDEEADEKTPDEEEKSSVKEALSDATLENFGFVTGQDVGDSQPEEKEGETTKKSEEIDKDEEIQHPVKPHVRHHTANQTIPTHAVSSYTDDEEQSDDPEKQTARLPSLSLGFLSVIPKTIMTLAQSVSRIPIFNRLGKRFIILLPLFILLLLGLAFLYIFKLGATVTVAIEPRTTGEQEKVTFSTSGDSDFPENVIAAKIVETSLSGSATTDATGKKEVGEKAKGTVTIFNSDTARKQLSQGTVITSGNDLEFVLDKDVTIASASGDIFSGIKSGTTQVAVTAEEIGTNYNLPSNTKFTIGTNTVLAARNDAAFSGGSKKTVTVVSQKDIDRLTSDLPKGLADKAREDLGKKIGDDEIIIPQFVSTELEKEAFDRDLDDEAKTVKLTGTIVFQSAVYKKADLMQFSQAILKNKLTQDVTIPETGITTEVKDIKVTDDEILATISINAGLLPKMDQEAIRKSLAGKSFADANDLLMELPQVKETELHLSPNIPFLPKTLPRISSNIQLIIQTDE